MADAKKMSKETYATPALAKSAAKKKGITVIDTKEMPSGRHVYVYEDTTLHYENGRKTGLAKIENEDKPSVMAKLYAEELVEKGSTNLRAVREAQKKFKFTDEQGNWLLKSLGNYISNAKIENAMRPSKLYAWVGDKRYVKDVKTGGWSETNSGQRTSDPSTIKKLEAELKASTTLSTAMFGNTSIQNSWHLHTAADIQKMAKEIGAPPPSPVIIKAVLALIKRDGFNDEMAIKVVTGKVPPNHYENAVGDEYSHKLGYEAAKAGKAKVVPHNRAGREIWFQDWILGYEKYKKGGGIPVQNASPKGNGSTSVDGTIINFTWEDMDNMMAITITWPRARDNDFKFIAAAERAAVKEVKSKSGVKFSISGGSGSVGNRQISGGIMNAMPIQNNSGWEVVTTGRDYEKKTKKFLIKSSDVSPNRAEHQAREYSRKLNAEDKASSHGLYRSIDVRALNSKQFENGRKKAQDRIENSWDESFGSMGEAITAYKARGYHIVEMDSDDAIMEGPGGRRIIISHSGYVTESGK